MQKFEFLRQPLLGELAMSRKKERERERRRERMPFIVATYVYASSQGHTRTPLGPMINMFDMVYYMQQNNAMSTLGKHKGSTFFTVVICLHFNCPYSHLCIQLFTLYKRQKLCYWSERSACASEPTMWPLFTRHFCQAQPELQFQLGCVSFIFISPR